MLQGTSPLGTGHTPAPGGALGGLGTNGDPKNELAMLETGGFPREVGTGLVPKGDPKDELAGLESKGVPKGVLD